MIFGINGKVRCGKGILLALMALGACEDGYQVLCNFRLDHKNARELSIFEFLGLINAQRPLDRTVLVIQEIYGWLNSHKSMSNVSELEDTFVFQSGKLNYDIYYDTQVQMRALGSLRDMTDFRFEAVKSGDTVENFEDGFFHYYPLNVHNHDENERVGEGFRIPFKVASFWWDLFDTYARTMPLGFANLVASAVKVDPVETMRFVGRQVDLLLEHPELYLRSDRVSVSCALKELGESDLFASEVANRLELRLKHKPLLLQKKSTLQPSVRVGLQRW